MKTRLRALLSTAAVAIAACGIAPRTETPIPVIASSEVRNSKTLIVMLPGRGDRASSFLDADFLQHPGAGEFDIVAVDAHFGYYMKRTLIPRLHDDVILPSLKAGYENIWLLGVSMGGLGAILYAAEHPENVDGLVLLAPYLGDPALASEVQASGGLAIWKADDSEFKSHEVDAWRWLQSSRLGSEPVPILLGYGLDDRFANNYRPLQDEISGIDIFTEVGGHNWTTWNRLWQVMQTDLEQHN